MHTREQLSEFIAYSKKTNQDVLNAAIANDLTELENLLNHNVSYDYKKAIRKASDAGSWQCCLYLAKIYFSHGCDGVPDFKILSTALLEICRINDNDLIQQLTSIIDSDKRPGFPDEIFKKDTWLQLGSNYLADDTNGYTALHWCVVNNNSFLIDRIKRECSNIPFNVRDHFGRTPFQTSIMLGFIEFSQKLGRLIGIDKIINECDSSTFEKILKYPLQFSKDSILNIDKTKLLKLIDQLSDKYKYPLLSETLSGTGSFSKLMLYKNSQNGREPDKDTTVILAEMKLTLMDKTENQSKVASSTALVTCNMYSAGTQQANESQPFLNSAQDLKPVYHARQPTEIKEEQISSYSNVTQFNAIFSELPLKEQPKKSVTETISSFLYG